MKVELHSTFNETAPEAPAGYFRSALNRPANRGNKFDLHLEVWHELICSDVSFLPSALRSAYRAIADVDQRLMLCHTLQPSAYPHWNAGTSREVNWRLYKSTMQRHHVACK